MEKIKVIELLNKIANGEEPPKKIKYRGIIYEYDINNMCYYVKDLSQLYKDIDYYDLYMELSDLQGQCLTTEVEIIEDKKIEPLNVKSFEETPYFASNGEIMAIKINEIIEVLNERDIQRH